MSFLYRIFPSVTLAVGLSACDMLGLGGDPMADVPRMSEVAMAEQTEVASIVAPDESPSIFGRFLNAVRPAPNVGDVDAALNEALGITPEVPVQEASAAVVERAEKPSLLGGLMDRLSSVVPEASKATAPLVQVAPNTQQDFGVLTATCDVSGRQLGRKIAEASGFKIYDTIPNSTAIRPHYITGFDDGCARQFSAALVLMGDVGTHEIVRYSRTRVKLDYSETDDAYEAIKASFCRVPQGEPCGNRLEALGKKATFVTAYERFGSSPIWAEFLLHDGEVAAIDLEGE